MKWRVFSLAGLFCVFCGNSFAQVSARDGFSVGGNVSVNSTWIINQNAYEVFRLTCDDEGLWDAEPDYRITVGYGLGASAAFRSKSFWGFMAEMNYARAGQNYKDGFTTTICPEHSSFERKFTLHYLQVPLMAKFTAVNRRDVKWYVLTGPQIGLLLGAKETVIIGGTEQPEDLFTPAKEKVKAIDFDFVIGTGADIFLADNIYLSAGFKTYIGLIDINSNFLEDYILENEGSYQASRNFSAGLHIGVHFLFDWVGSFYR